MPPILIRYRLTDHAAGGKLAFDFYRKCPFPMETATILQFLCHHYQRSVLLAEGPTDQAVVDQLLFGPTLDVLIRYTGVCRTKALSIVNALANEGIILRRVDATVALCPSGGR